MSWEEDLLARVNVVVDAVSYLAGEAEEGGCGLWAWAVTDEFACARRAWGLTVWRNALVGFSWIF